MRLQILISLLGLLMGFTSAYTWTTKDACPNTIKTVVSSDPCAYDGYHYLCTKVPQFTTMDSVHKALTHCPNITALDLRVTRLGCSEWSSSWSFPLSPWGGDRYANLTTLRVEGYNFGTRNWLRRSDPYTCENGPLQWIRKVLSTVGLENYSQRLLSYVPVKSNLDLWLEAMDWSGIEELMISDITDDILQKVPPRLKSLTRLETTNLSFVEAFPENTLTHLTWIGESSPSDLPHILERQGASLQNLHFRLPERTTGSFLPDFNISMLPTMAPNLSHISLNVPRNGTWPLDTLRIISSLPELCTADIYMNLQSECAQERSPYREMGYEEWKTWQEGCSGEEQYQEPAMSKEGALEMFEHMREVKSGVELRNVSFYVGDWTRPYDEQLYDPDWFEGRAEKVACSVVNDGDDGWCVVERAREMDGDEYM